MRAAAEVARAKGEAEARVLRAQAQAEANRLLDESLTPKVIQFLAIDKLAPTIDIALIPSGQGIILDPATLLGGLDDDEDETPAGITTTTSSTSTAGDGN